MTSKSYINRLLLSLLATLSFIVGTAMFYAAPVAAASLPEGTRCFQKITHPTVTDAMKELDCNTDSIKTLVDSGIISLLLPNLGPNSCIVFDNGNAGPMPSQWDCAKVDAKVKETQAAGDPQGTPPRCIAVSTTGDLAYEASCAQGYSVAGKTFVPEMGKCYVITPVTGGDAAEAFDCTQFDTKLKSLQQTAHDLQNPTPQQGVLPTNVQRDTVANCNGTTQATLQSCLQANPIVDIINRVINILSITAGVAITAMLVVAGIQYSTAGANPQAVGAAKGKIMHAIIALLAFFFIYAFVQWLVPGGIF